MTMGFQKIGSVLGATALAAALSGPGQAAEAPKVNLAPETLAQIQAQYRACILEELVAAKNDDGTLDTEFFAEGKAHCDETMRLDERIATANAQKVALTDAIVAGAMAEAGIKRP